MRVIAEQRASKGIVGVKWIVGIMIEGKAASRRRVGALVFPCAFKIDAYFERMLSRHPAQVMHETEKCVRNIPRQRIGYRNVGRVRNASERKAGEQHLRVGGRIKLQNVDPSSRARHAARIFQIVVVFALTHAENEFAKNCGRERLRGMQRSGPAWLELYGGSEIPIGAGAVGRRFVLRVLAVSRVKLRVW